MSALKQGFVVRRAEAFDQNRLFFGFINGKTR
jgi:hypothetical protein